MDQRAPVRVPVRREPAGRACEIPPDVYAAALLDQLPAIVYVSEAGAAGRWHYVSRGVRTILGFSATEFRDDPGLWARQIDPRDRARVLEREDGLVDPSIPDEYRMRHRSGSVVWVRDEAALVADAQGRLQWHGVISDITDRKLAESELAVRADQQAAVAALSKHALEGAPHEQLMDEVLEAALRLDRVRAAAVVEFLDDGATLTVRARRGAWPPGQLERASTLRTPQGDDGVWEHAIGPQQLARAALTRVRIGTATGSWGELWLTCSDAQPGEIADLDYVQALAHTLAGAITRRAAEARVRHQAVHDPLTGLPNRVYFLERLGDALSDAGANLAVMLLDIDNFKLVNDSLGHAAGDELLIQVAPRLRTALGPGDLIARLGGDEFVMLLAGLGGDRRAAEIAERIVSVFESPFRLSTREHFAKASLGIALARPGESTPVSVLRDADSALYEAKKRGRARFEVFSSAMRTRTLERLAIENDLRRALEREQLHLAYQPVVSLRDGSINSVEALLRWHRPGPGSISPAESIPVAEESGMIEEIGMWVLQTACAQGARWQAHHRGAPAIGIAVNISARQFMLGRLETIVTEALAASGLDPSTLSLEITESVLLEDPRAVGATIASLARLGVRFVLDDFGTGYSSLAYLSDLPIHGIKVDRSFVAALGLDERSTAITTAVVRMAQALSIDVTAEGVETEGQSNLLRALGCKFAQGFLFHRPLRADDVSALLAQAAGPARRRPVAVQAA
jgi:diguanylate cyclase (GGDEF)-like protein/PAS domain S-box-containing protein